MIKIKTSKSMVKRFSLTSTGKFLRHKASKSHLLEKKTSKRKQKLKKIISIDSKSILSLTRKLPYKF
uniref:Large ribosomal subunit protein bL35c n=1 Tax=Caulacanthus okamurae TaxID=152008 RepID=A0A6H1U760_9FLOR|nr:50S ribosomal protein L35 [Caulacanthus okamurae]QIZ74684.1 50S ribosomal protein L35 [Caulacanthus okamurae]